MPGSDREHRIARVLRPLGTAPMSREQARRAGQLLGLHWTSVYRLRTRFLRDPVMSSLAPRPSGPSAGLQRLDARVEAIVEDVLQRWLPRQHELAHPPLSIHLEVRRRCGALGLTAPSRTTTARRLTAHREAQTALLAIRPEAQIPPGSLEAARPLDIVQVDHTQADVFVVDRWTRRTIGRPWLSMAIDVATRCVVAIYLAMERPNAATVALLVSRIVLPKEDWLAHLGVEASWPMHGIPKTLHLDNAAEFRGRALRLGCAQYGIELDYRPVGRPHYGGHIERMNRTLMQRLKGLPGATGNSPKGRKARKPEDKAVLTLAEFERWLAVEVGLRYHHSEHRGLHGATPASAWAARADSSIKTLPADPEAALRFLIHFMPVVPRTIQANGLTVFYIRYWNPVFAAWREARRPVRVRYHPEDLSRVFVSADGRNYVEARYADLRRPAISLWEQRAAVRALRAQGEPKLSEHLLFKAIEQQRRIVERARRKTQHTRATGKTPRTHEPESAAPSSWPAANAPAETPSVDYGASVEPFPVEMW